MNVQAWIEQSLWKDCYFVPSLAGEGVEIFRSGVSFPLLASLIDGCHGTPHWPQGASRSLTAALFDAIRPLVRRDGASWFYITDPDNALSVFHWEKVIDPDFLNEFQLQEFELRPAEEGGTSCLGIAFHHGEGLLVFELSNCFTICYYGTPRRIEELKACLQHRSPEGGPAAGCYPAG